MSKTDGYSNYVCDRCAKSIYAQSNAPETQSWREIKRISADGNTVSRLLCGDCASAYRDLAQKQDTAFGDFMANKVKEQ